MSEFINTADVIGDDEMCDQIIQRTVTEYKENRITTVGEYAFYGCASLTAVDVPNVTNIEANSLYNCSALGALILGGDTVVTLANTNALTGSGIAAGTGYVYVPSALLADYQAATNWSTYADQFRAIEDCEVESITLNASELIFSTEDSQTLVATTVPEGHSVTWYSSDDSIVSVSETGVVTPHSHGTATITAYSLLHDVSAQCSVTVSAEVEFTNILADIEFSAGYLSNGSANEPNSTADVYTDKFTVADFVGESIVVTLLDVKSTASNSRICYYDSNNGFISQTDGTASGNNVTITSTVPTNAVYAAISVNKSAGFSGINIVCDDRNIGSIEY